MASSAASASGVWRSAAGISSGSWVHSRAPPVIIVRAVAGDHGQPAAESAIVAQRGKLPQRRQEHVLHQVVHFAVRHARQQDAVHHAGVPVVEPAKRGAAAVAGCARQFGVIGDRNNRRGTHLPSTFRTRRRG